MIGQHRYSDAERPSLLFGRESTAGEVAKSADLRGRRAVVTGASSGLGMETARCLALAGADLVVGVRQPERAAMLAAEIRDSMNGTLTILPLDLSDLASIENFARSVAGPIDLLIANAGVSKTPDAHLPNGMDVRFATNHLGHFLLTHLLYRQLAMRGARIVILSSAAHKGRPLRFDDLNWQARD
ncbi:MAG: SDR family NAD(P)-dependent oxidoreductase, partial [Rhizorhabdus sp.]